MDRKIRCPLSDKEAPVPNDVQDLPEDFRTDALVNTMNQTAAVGGGGVPGTERGAQAAPVESCETDQNVRPCPVCNEIPTETKNLSCGHSLCNNCMQFLLPVGGDTLHCPTCSCKTRIVPASHTHPRTSSMEIQPGTWFMWRSKVWHKEGKEWITVKTYQQDLDKLKVGDHVGVQRRENGDLHFYINGADLGVAVSDIPANVYGVIELFGKAEQISITDTSKIAPAESRLRFHTNCGGNAVIHDNHITAHRQDTLNCPRYALVLTSRPLKPNELFEVQLDKTVDKWSSSIEIGVTTYSSTESALPTLISALGLGTWFMWRSKVWHKEGKEWITVKTYQQDLDKLKVGDHVGVQRRENGDLHFYINGADLGVAVSDVPANVYGVINVCGNVEQVTITDTSDKSQPSHRVSWMDSLRKKMTFMKKAEQ